MRKRWQVCEYVSWEREQRVEEWAIFDVDARAFVCFGTRPEMEHMLQRLEELEA